MQSSKITESSIQIAFFDYCRQRGKYETEWGMIFAVPMQTGGTRAHMIRASKMKLEGAAKGIPDIVVPVPKKPYHGAFYELKLETGTVSIEQKTWLEKLEKQGYFTKVVRTNDVLTLIRAVEDYFKNIPNSSIPN